MAELIAPVTGWDVDWKEGLATGKRILTLRQAFNAREGLKPDAFNLPERVKSPQSAGPAAGVKVDFEALKRGYFEAMGWSTGDRQAASRDALRLGMEKLHGKHLIP